MKPHSTMKSPSKMIAPPEDSEGYRKLSSSLERDFQQKTSEVRKFFHLRSPLSNKEVRDHLVKFVMRKIQPSILILIFLEMKPSGDDKSRRRVVIEKNYRFEIAIIFNYKKWDAKVVRFFIGDYLASVDRDRYLCY